MDSEPAWQQRADVWYWPEEEQKADTVSQFLMRRSLTKKQIIRLKADIDNLFKAGKRYSLSCFKLYVAENDLSYSRIIVIPARHYGNSVVRNHIRRQIKEIFRTNMEMISEGRDFAVVIYPAKERNLSYEDREKVLIDLLRTSGSLKS